MKRRQGQRGRKRLGREGLVRRGGRKVDPVPNATAFCITLKTCTPFGAGARIEAHDNQGGCGAVAWTPGLWCPDGIAWLRQ